MWFQGLIQHWLVPAHFLLIVIAQLPLIGAELSPSPRGTSSVRVCKESRGRVVWTDPETR